jgi:hypothetical protein
MGLQPGFKQRLLFVDRVADADVVLHVKPKRPISRGERHYQYEEVSECLPLLSLPNHF